MTKYAPLATGYILAVSILNLMGFWDEFEINVLEFISITEVTVVALKSLISSLGPILVGAFLSELFITSHFSAGGGRDTPEGNFLNKYWKLLLLPFIVVSVYLIYEGHPEGYFIIGLTVAPIIGIWLTNNGFLKDAITNLNTRSSVLIFSTMILCFAYPSGYRNAHLVKENKEQNIVVIKDSEFVYVGKLGNHVFILDKETDNIIQLTPVPEHMEFIRSKRMQPDGYATGSLNVKDR
jgi:hypothetical protein